MATGISYKNIIGGIQWPISETPPFYKRKNLAKISYTTRVIANFVPNFVAISTGVGRGKCNWQHSITHNRKPTYSRKNLAIISYSSRVKANFVPNFIALATYVGCEKCNRQHSMAHPQNRFMGAQISPESFTQAEL